MDIGPETPVCDLLAEHPQVFEVFERHGMCADCRVAPPPVPLQHFVDKHCQGDLAGFLREIEARLAAN
jgi:hypothetical protein